MEIFEFFEHYSVSCAPCPKNHESVDPGGGGEHIYIYNIHTYIHTYIYIHYHDGVRSQERFVLWFGELGFITVVYIYIWTLWVNLPAPPTTGVEVHTIGTIRPDKPR